MPQNETEPSIQKRFCSLLSTLVVPEIPKGLGLAKLSNDRLFTNDCSLVERKKRRAVVLSIAQLLYRQLALNQSYVVKFLQQNLGHAIV